MVPDTCCASRTPSETVSVQPRGSDTHRNGLSLNNTVSLQAASKSNSQNTITESLTPVMSVTVDTSSIELDIKPGDNFCALQQPSTCPSLSESPMVACASQNIAQSNVTLTSTKLDLPTLEMPSSVQDSTIPFNGSLSSKMTNSSSDESHPQFQKTTSQTPFPNTSDSSSPPEFLLKTSINPDFSEIPSTGLMSKDTLAELSMENSSTKPSVFDNTPLTSPQARLSSSTAQSEETNFSATCYISSLWYTLLIKSLGSVK